MEDELLTVMHSINSKLSVLIGLRMESQEQSTRQKIAKLNDLGLDYKEVAMILGISASHAAKEISLLKKK